VITCTGCGQAKPDSAYYHHKGKRNGRRCIACLRAASKRPARPPVTEKRCPECGVVKPHAAFRKHVRGPASRTPGRVDLAGYCLECEGDRHRRKYGLTPETFRAMIERQAGCCAICEDPILVAGAPGDGARGSAQVDHDHDTGKVRGLLCRSCNVGIGNLGEDPERLMAAAAYLLAHRDVLADL
jgi:hypothetical protein